MVQAACRLRRSERFIIASLAVTSSLCAILALQRTVTFDIEAYVFLSGLGVSLVCLGLFYRLSGRSPAIGATVIGTGLFLWLTLSVSTLNYLLLPVRVGSMDSLLAGLDGALGFHWPAVMETASRHPALAEVLGIVYQTSLLQIAVLIVTLGLTSRLAELDRMLVTLSVAAMATVAFWSIFPSLGTAAIYALPADVVAKVGPVVDLDYGRGLVDLATHGAAFIDPRNAKGLIAFPSFHTVIAFVCVFYSRRVKWLFAVLLPLNMTMLPAIVIHGGHHLVDLVGGAVFFAAASIIAEKILDGHARRSNDNRRSPATSMA